MIDMDSIKDKVDDLIHNKPIVFFTTLILLILFLVGLVVLLIQTSPSSSKVKEEKQVPFSPDEEIMIPDAPDVEKDYFPSRTTEGRWGDADLEKWFTYPNEKIMQKLEKSNDKIVDDITGNAP